MNPYSIQNLRSSITACQKKYGPVQNELQQPQDSDRFLLFPMVIAASKAMHSKLKTYKEDHLPGERYYDPEPHVRSVLSTLQPNNNRTEGVFGANNRILPNMSLSTRSSLTLQERTRIIEKGQEREKRQLDEIKLEPLVTSLDELNQRVTSIISLSISKTIQDAELKKLVQRQVQLRSIVFHQSGIKLYTIHYL